MVASPWSATSRSMALCVARETHRFSRTSATASLNVFSTTYAQCALAALIHATMSLCMASSAEREPARRVAAETSRRAACAYAASIASGSRPARHPGPSRARVGFSSRYLAAPFAAAATVSSAAASAFVFSESVRIATRAAARRTLSR